MPIVGKSCKKTCRKKTRPQRRIDHEYSRSLPEILARCRISLLVTTYQAGKLVVVAARPDGQGLTLSFRNYTSPMGVAVRSQGDLAALATETQIWQLRNVPGLAGRLDPPGEFDACFLPRRAEYTGPIDAHEMAWVGGDLWVVNTLFSCLCTLDGIHNFVPRWQPPFISALAAEDRCHLNGMTCDEQGPRYVTALGETDAPQGWRPGKASGGCVIDVKSGQTVLKGLSMPHSPRLRGELIWLLESGRGRLVRFRPGSALAEPVVELPGYTRGPGVCRALGFCRLIEDSRVVDIRRPAHRRAEDAAVVRDFRRRVGEQSRNRSARVPHGGRRDLRCAGTPRIASPVRGWAAFWD